MNHCCRVNRWASVRQRGLTCWLRCRRAPAAVGGTPHCARDRRYPDSSHRLHRPYIITSKLYLLIIYLPTSKIATHQMSHHKEQRLSCKLPFLFFSLPLIALWKRERFFFIFFELSYFSLFYHFFHGQLKSSDDCNGDLNFYNVL